MAGMLGSCRSAVILQEGRFGHDPSHPTLTLHGRIDPSLQVELHVEYEATRSDDRACLGYEGETGLEAKTVRQNYSRLLRGAEYSVDLLLDPHFKEDCRFRVLVFTRIYDVAQKVDTGGWQPLVNPTSSQMPAQPRSQPLTVLEPKTVACELLQVSGKSLLACRLTSSAADGTFRKGDLGAQSLLCERSCNLEMSFRDLDRRE
jgi:hypothetical protein